MSKETSTAGKRREVKTIVGIESALTLIAMRQLLYPRRAKLVFEPTKRRTSEQASFTKAVLCESPLALKLSAFDWKPARN